MWLMVRSLWHSRNRECEHSQDLDSDRGLCMVGQTGVLVGWQMMACTIAEDKADFLSLISHDASHEHGKLWRVNTLILWSGLWKEVILYTICRSPDKSFQVQDIQIKYWWLDRIFQLWPSKGFYDNRPTTNATGDEETKSLRRRRTRAGQILLSSLEARSGNCPKLKGLGFTALPPPEASALSQAPGVLWAIGHVGFQCHPCPDCLGNQYSCFSSKSAGWPRRDQKPLFQLSPIPLGAFPLPHSVLSFLACKLESTRPRVDLTLQRGALGEQGQVNTD